MHRFYLQLKALQEMQDPSFDSKIGICSHLLGAFYESHDHDTLLPFMIEWPESADEMGIYPIEGNSDEFALDGRWEGERGEKRRRLAKYLFDRFLTFGMQ